MANKLLGDSKFFEETVKVENLKKLLDGRSQSGIAGVAERLQAMKWLLAMISKGHDVSQFYPDVVKNVAVKAVELKKLVYIFLLHYTDHDAECRGLALLSINSFQKDLADSNQLIRALALRTMTSIRVKDIIQLQLIAITRSTTDTSAYVRKTAAHAIPKLFSLDASMDSESLVELVRRLLSDPSPMVVGAAMAAFQEICPLRYDVIHSVFRKLCRIIGDIDEWGQIFVLEVLARYIRCHFADPRVGVADPPTTVTNDGAQIESSLTMQPSGRHWPHSQQQQQQQQQHYSESQGRSTPDALPTKEDLDSFYDDDDCGVGAHASSGASNASPPMANEPPPPPVVDLLSGNSDVLSFSQAPTAAASQLAQPSAHQSGHATIASRVKAPRAPGALKMQDDHKTMLRAALPLLRSRNSGVVLSASSMLWSCGKRSDGAVRRIAQALVRQLRGPREVQYATLCAIIPIAQDRPDVFRPYLASFFVREPTDAAFVMMLKLDLLSLLVTADTVAVVLTELETYVDNANKSFVGGAVRCVGRIAGAIPAATEQCLSGLMTLITCPHDHVVAEAVVVTRTLLQQRHSQYPHVVRQVVDKLARIVEPSARASIVWIAAEHVDAIMPRAPDILRSLATSFADEDTLVKAQIVNFAIKLAVRFDRLGASDELHQWGAISRSQFARVAPQVVLLLRYVLEQARFDSDYDVRDRARSVYVLLSPVWASGDNDDAASAAAASGASAAFERASLFLCPKPTPVVQSVDSAVATDVYGRFSVSSLSHVVGHMAFNYQALPPWPRPGIDVVPSNSVRDASASAAAASNASSNTRVNSGKSRDRTVATSDLLGVKPLAATTSASRRRSSSAGGSSYDSHSSSSGSDGVSSGSSSSDDSDDSYTSDSGSSRSRSSSSSSSDTDADEASGDRGVATTTTTAAHVHQALSTTSQGQVQQSQHQHQQALNVLDLYSSTGTAAAAATPMHGTSQGDVVDVGQSTVDLAALDLSSSLSSSPSASPAATAATAVANEKVLLSHVHSSGLQVNYWFTRETSIYSLAMTVVKLRLTNTRASALRSVRVDKMRLLPHQQMVPFPTLDVLEGHATAFAQVHIDFAGDARQACKFDLASDRGGAVTVSLSVPAGELMTRAGVPVDRASFELARAALSGMHETKCSFERTPPIGADVSLDSWVERQVLRIGNFARVSMPTPPAGGDAVGESPVVCGYAARSSQDQLVLVTVELEERCGAEGSAANKTVLVRLAMNSGDVMLGTRLLDEMKTLLKETP